MPKPKGPARVWASLGPRRARPGRRWGLAGTALGVVGASQRPLLASLRPRRPRRGSSGRRWGIAGAALGVAEGPLFR